MATYTVPAGYFYWDQSAQRSYSAGTTINIVPDVGDSLMYNTTGVSYTYQAAYTEYPYTYMDTAEKQAYAYSVSAGWRANIGNAAPSTTTLFDSIAGVNIIYVHVNYNTTAKIINNIPNKVEVFNAGTVGGIERINGIAPTTLKYFYCRSASNLQSVPNFSQCINWLHGRSCFSACTSLIVAPTLPTSLQIASTMFEDCTSLITGADIPSTVLEASKMYRNCSQLTTTPANNSTIITDLSHCFNGCSAITTAENFNIRGTNSLNAHCIFYGCAALETGPTITSASDLSYGFYNCHQLTAISTLPSNITNLNYTFYNCSSLTSTPDLSNISLGTGGLTYTFYGCSSLATITSFPQQHGSEALHCAHAFENCTSLTIIPTLPNYIGSMQNMFSNCTNLQPQNIFIPHMASGLISCFAGDSNLSGIVTLDRNISDISNMFENVNGPIIITGDNTLNSTDLLVMGSNVYKELEIEPDTVTTVRCRDTNGTLDDNGEYIKLTAHFTSIVLPNTKVYVPKVYIKTDQQEPVVNWKLTNNTTQTITTIANSTDISVTRIEAGNLITDGTFESYFEISENEVLNYKVYIATSAPNVYEWDELESTIQTITKYWNGLPGSSIFTSSTFIFDATPDGNSFKIGGPIQEEEEEGFIVGNRGLPLLADQYPSTFNGPVTITSLLNLELPNYQITDTVDKEIYDLILTLGWGNDVLS